MEWNASKITQQEFRACVYKARTHRQTTLIRATGVAEQDSMRQSSSAINHKVFLTKISNFSFNLKSDFEK